MATITIPKNKYEELKQYASAYFKIVDEIEKVESIYLYDEKFVKSLAKKAREDFKKGKCIEAASVNEALAKFKKK